jgi:heme/copper-type cytochrome/quinol oxidase subunit 1
MDYDWFKVVGAVAGIGGIALASVAYIFREIIRKEIFPQLTKAQAYKLLNRIISLIFIIGILGVVAYIFVSFLNGRSNSNVETAPSPTPTTSDKIDGSQTSANSNVVNNVQPYPQTPPNLNTNRKQSHKKRTTQPSTPSGIIQQSLDRPSEAGRNE